MQGYYFINTDLKNGRAHTYQILNTSSSINSRLSIGLVAPRYGTSPGEEELKRLYGLDYVPDLNILFNFGLTSPGTLAFILFNISATAFLLSQKITKGMNFIYVRSSFFLPLVIIAWLFRVPCFYETHRKPLTSTERFLDGFLSRLAFGIILVSDYIKGYYTRYQKPLLVSHDAVSLERFLISMARGEARIKLGLPSGKKICLYTGTISKLKGLDYVLKSARLVPGIDFILVGILAPEFVGVTLPSNVKVLPKVNQKEIPMYLRAADVLLLPHPKGEYSQSPLKLFEYMASGTPIVASDLPSIREILDTSNSILVDPENPEGLVTGINKALEEDAKVLGVKAKEDVRSHTWEARGIAIAEFIKKII